MSPATSSTISTRPSSRQRRNWRVANTLSSTVVRFLAGARLRGLPGASAVRANAEYRLKVAEGAANGNGGGAAALFNFDHSEFEASLGADYSNIEETARSSPASR